MLLPRTAEVPNYGSARAALLTQLELLGATKIYARDTSSARLQVLCSLQRRTCDFRQIRAFNA